MERSASRPIHFARAVSDQPVVSFERIDEPSCRYETNTTDPPTIIDEG
jgi:hypothetical protein